MGFTISSDQLIWFCTLVAGLWGLWKIIKEVRKPNQDLKDVVAKHERLLANDDQRMKEFEDSNRMILQCLLVIINHDITGNGIDRMKEARDELQDYLINK